MVYVLYITKNYTIYSFRTIGFLTMHFRTHSIIEKDDFYSYHLYESHESVMESPQYSHWACLCASQTVCVCVCVCAFHMDIKYVYDK